MAKSPPAQNVETNQEKLQRISTYRRNLLSKQVLLKRSAEADFAIGKKASAAVKIKQALAYSPSIEKLEMAEQTLQTTTVLETVRETSGDVSVIMEEVSNLTRGILGDGDFGIDKQIVRDFEKTSDETSIALNRLSEQDKNQFPNTLDVSKDMTDNEFADLCKMIPDSNAGSVSVLSVCSTASAPMQTKPPTGESRSFREVFESEKASRETSKVIESIQKCPNPPLPFERQTTLGRQANNPMET